MANNFNNNSPPRKPKPLPFHLLYRGSKFKIHSEKSRGIELSNDPNVYRKVEESYSVLTDAKTGRDVDPEVAIILRPQDLVIPEGRPPRSRAVTNR